MLYDVDLETLGPSWPSFDDALSARPAAVVVAHLYGFPVDMSRVMERAHQQQVAVIEDSAQGAGATLRSRPLATFGDLRILSFGRGKGVTGGSGGALLLSSDWRGPEPKLDTNRSSALRELTALAVQSALARPSLYRLPASLPWLDLGATRYREPTPAKEISRTAAAVAEVGWRAHGSEVAARRRNASRLRELVARLPDIRAPRPIAGAEPGWLRFPIIGAPHESAELPLGKLKAAGIMPGYPKPLSRLHELRLGSSTGSMAGATLLATRLWTLATHSLSSAPEANLLQHLSDGK
jgi:dTDP-4-amino-4,6-dideoxygalactose transaminase